MHRYLLIFFISLIPFLIQAQTGKVSGVVRSENEPVAFAQVYLEHTTLGSITDEQGNFNISDVPFGTYKLVVSFVGYTTMSEDIVLGEQHSKLEFNFELEESLELDQIVVTGTKTEKRQTNSPIIVNVTNSETLEAVQACNLSEGLKFQPGLRVETDCQTCNYTQLRMNGLAGGYSQILVNGRPIFSPLTGLYGMEQLPVNMIDRIEVVRGGGSSLYGSSAIGGTVNVITKIPKENSYSLDYNYQNINGQTSDHQLMGNATVLSKAKNMGISFFLNRRDRGFYDDNDDNFSEIPLIRNTSIGTNLFFLPKRNQKLEISLSNLNEYRFGGEMVDNPAYLTQQSEERTHRVWMGSADYQVNFNEDKTSLISYFAWQHTGREHYTGIIPDSGQDLQNHLENPPYGDSKVQTFNVGLQLNHRLHKFLGGENVLTFGAEYIHDAVFDEIVAYNYLVDQTSKNFGAFVQSDWEIVPQLTLLAGLRLDVHNLMDKPTVNPRVSLLYKVKNSLQFRVNYGSGFRAPQAFDTDLHIAFAGGGISRVQLSPNLQPERSQSISGSINYDKLGKRFIAGFTIEGFYNRLKDAFYLNPIGEDAFGEVFEKQNGQGATVKGATIEARFNYDRKVQLETGFTLQTSQFDDAVEYIENVPSIKRFIRTPNAYGFANLNITPTKAISANVNYVFTGKMEVPHFAGAPNQLVDEIITSPTFHELSAKFGYTFNIEKINSGIELYAGVKNITNSYQSTFDIGKDRDSNFVYGPAQPRTFFVGLKLATAR